MKEGDIVKINPQNNGFIGWAEFLEIIRDFGKRDPEEYYVIDRYSRADLFNCSFCSRFRIFGEDY